MKALALGAVAYAGCCYFAFVAAKAPIYDGPVNLPGIKRVTVNTHYTSYGSGSPGHVRVEGNDIGITFEDGTTTTLWDKNANWRVDSQDTIQGKNPENLAEILNATKREMDR